MELTNETDELRGAAAPLLGTPLGWKLTILEEFISPSFYRLNMIMKEKMWGYCTGWTEKMGVRKNPPPP